MITIIIFKPLVLNHGTGMLQSHNTANDIAP